MNWGHFRKKKEYCFPNTARTLPGKTEQTRSAVAGRGPQSDSQDATDFMFQSSIPWTENRPPLPLAGIKRDSPGAARADQRDGDYTLERIGRQAQRQGDELNSESPVM
jgi:hypothetical protein